MKTLLISMAFGVCALASVGAYAAAPAGAIAQCKDGTYFTGTEHKGACKGHQGVKEWLDKDKGAAASTSTKPTAASTAATTPAATTAASDAPKTSKKPKKAADAAAASPTPATPAAPVAPVAPTPVPKPAAPAPATAPAAATTHTPPTPASQITQKPGGGAGKVWVNASSKVYHCPGDEWYGKTKEGSYMTEAAAKAAGNHGAHNKECGG